MMPQAGGMYVYLREAYSPFWGFLYGWTLFTVIQTGTIAAVCLACARFSGVLWRAISEEHYLIAPIRISTHYAVSLSTAQLLALRGERPEWFPTRRLLDRAVNGGTIAVSTYKRLRETRASPIMPL